MKILRTLAELKNFQKFLDSCSLHTTQNKDREKRISQEKLVFIPTMGALHDGHISLIQEANALQKKENIKTKIIVSIFVNPTQFQFSEISGKSDDYENYPNTLDSDIKKLEIAGVDAVFIPEISEIYPCRGVCNTPLLNMNLPLVFSELEGKTRKGHFEGVFQVVKRLFELVKPDYAIFGQKDFQQVMLIQYLQKKYFPNLKIIIAPLFREKSGLAYSSRNMRFSSEEKTRAVVLFQALSKMKEKFLENNNETPLKTSDLIKIGKNILEKEKLVKKIHYISVRDSKTFSEISEKKYPQKGDIILLSVEFSGIHLIDNMIL